MKKNSKFEIKIRPLNKKIGKYVVLSYEDENYSGIINYFTDVISSKQSSIKV